MIRWLRLGVAALVVLAWRSPQVADAQERPPSLEHARLLYDAGRLDEARTELRALVGAGTREPAVYLLLGVVDRSDGRYASAIASLERAQTLSPDAAPVAVELATTLAWDRQLRRAVTLYKQVLIAEPRNVGARVGLAFALAWQGKLDQSRALFQQLTADDPSNTSAWMGLGFVERAAFHRRESAEAYERALALEPGNAAAKSALQELQWDRRGQVRFLAGATSLPGDVRSGEARVDAAYAATPTLTVLGAFQRYAFGAVSPVVGGGAIDGSRAESSVEGGAVYRPSPRLTAAANLYTFFSKDSKRGVLWLEAMTPIVSHVSLIAGLRPILSTTEPRSLLGGSVGATVALPHAQQASARVLVSGNTDFEPRTTFLANYDIAFSKRLQGRGSAAHSRGARFGFTSYSAGATFLATPTFGFSGDIGRRTGTAERSTLAAGVVLRY